MESIEMENEMSTNTEVDKSDRLGLFLAVGFAVLAVIAAIATTVRRLVEVAPGHNIPVLLPLTGETAQLPLGPDGALVATTLDRGTVVLADPTPAMLAALWAEPIVVGVAWGTCMVIAALLLLRLARAQIFTRGSARLVYVAAGVVTVGWVVGSTLNAMIASGTFTALSDDTLDPVYVEVSLAPAVAVMALAAVGVVIQIGERLQRDTRGLV